MTGTDGVYVERAASTPATAAARRAPATCCCIRTSTPRCFETARGGMLREGLAFDRCEVAVVTNIGVGDHLGLNYITTVEDLAVVKRVIVQNVADGYAVLNAADPMVVKMASHCPGAVIFFAATATIRAGHATARRASGSSMSKMRRHRRRAGRKSEHRVPLAEAIPLTRNGTIGFQIENAMAAIAAAWALGMDWESIRAGLGSLRQRRRHAARPLQRLRATRAPR
jgi:cyanophycin synthetase